MTADSDGNLTLTSSGGYVGPASVMFEVTDQMSDDQKDVHTAYVSVPVQIGPRVPLLRCPTSAVTRPRRRSAERASTSPRSAARGSRRHDDGRRRRSRPTWEREADDVRLERSRRRRAHRHPQRRAATPAPARACSAIGVEGLRRHRHGQRHRRRRAQPAAGRSRSTRWPTCPRRGCDPSPSTGSRRARASRSTSAPTSTPRSRTRRAPSTRRR